MLSSRVLGLFGLAISIVGTLGMLWGGLEAFIVVKPRTAEGLSFSGMVYDPDGHVKIHIGNSVLLFTEHNDARWHILANKLGKGALASGLTLQFIALIIDQ